MSDFPHDIMATASWVAAHRLDLSKEAGQQIVRLIAHSLNDERTKSAARIAALEAENAELREDAKGWMDAAFLSDNEAYSSVPLETLREENTRLRKALEPFALISMEGLVADDVYTTVTMCSEYFHTAAKTYREAKP